VSSQQALQIGLNILRGRLDGQRARERVSASLLNISKKKENYIPPGLGHSQLLSSSHSSTNLSTSLVTDLKSLPFQGLLQTKLLEFGAKA